MNILLQLNWKQKKSDRIHHWNETECCWTHACSVEPNNNGNNNNNEQKQKKKKGEKQENQLKTRIVKDHKMFLIPATILRTIKCYK